MVAPTALIERPSELPSPQPPAPPAPPQGPTRAVPLAPDEEPAHRAPVVPPALFFERLQRACSAAHPSLALMVVDIEGFHAINAAVGYLAGDRLLEAFARRLARRLRSDDLVTRIGGDEFAVLLDDVDAAGLAGALAHHVLAGLRPPFTIDRRPVACTARAGVALCPEHGRDVRVLLRAARAALRAARLTGTDVAVAHGHEMDLPPLAPALSRHDLADAVTAHELKAALLRGEFKVHYQPIHNFQSGCVEALEALVRWRHPAKGLLAPDEFLPAAERAGVARAIGMRVLDSACASLRGWRAAGHPALRVAVNLSAQDFHGDDFAEAVTSTLARHALPPSALELELTEHELLDDRRAVAQATELSRRGVSLSIDDFGTRYASLHYLHRLPVRAIKVDRSFVRDVGHSTASTSIVAAVVGIAGKMGLRLVAEGVEEVRQMSELRRLGCHIMQGYLFSPPVPAGAVGDYLARTAHAI
jgi:diguanylate cyclase (GGDEF)-like protein